MKYLWNINNVLIVMNENSQDNDIGANIDINEI